MGAAQKSESGAREWSYSSLVRSEEAAWAREVARLYRHAGLEQTDGVAPSALISALLGAGSIRWLGHPWIPEGGSLVRVGDRWRVYLRRDLPLAQVRFVALHELAHWALGPGATEDECDALAARLLAPAPAFERALCETGPSYTRLARWFGCTETFAALRYGEVTEEPLVVVAPANVRIRGREYSWPSEPELRGLVRGRAVRGVRKARLRDDPMRVALRAG